MTTEVMRAVQRLHSPVQPHDFDLVPTMLNESITPSHSASTGTLAVAVLAGGRSRRFGRDKAYALFAGRSMLTIALTSALRVTDRVLVLGRDHIDWKLCELDAAQRGKVELVSDVVPDQGPVGGLQAALAHLDAPVLLLSCDMPAMSAGLLHWLIATWRSGPLQSGVLPMVDGQAQPCAAIYPRQALQPCVQALKKGQRALHQIARPGLMRPIAVSRDVAWRFANCNTPQELQELEHRLTKGGEVRG